MIGVIGIVVLIVLLLLRMWVGLAMAFVGFVGYVWIANVEEALQMAVATTHSTVNHYSLTAVPLFVLMGMIVSNTNISSELYEFAYKIFGHMRSGLAVATIAACGVFAAICGSSTAETLTIGKIALGEMKKYNYDDKLSTGCVACGGTIGILIPPSMGFLVYGILTEQSIGLLFMAGILPGILLMLLFIGTVFLISCVNPDAGPAGEKTSLPEKIKSLKCTIPIILLFGLVLGGIYMGVFTPTEAGAVGAFGAIVISLIKRELTFKNFLQAVYETAELTSMIILLLAGAYILNKFLTITELPFNMAEYVASFNMSKYVILTVIIIFYMLLGMFLDILSCIILTIPLIYPLIISQGFDPIWFGVMIVLIMEMGMITPPFGLNVFILSGITDVSIGTIFRGVWPFVAAIFVCIILITIFPQIVLFIPQNM